MAGRSVEGLGSHPDFGHRRAGDTIYAVIRKATRTWWLWGAGVAIVFAIFVATIGPVYIAPIFNTYKSLPNSPLKQQILSLARANGIPATDVYWFDESKQDKRMSANVSGMFSTTRISLNDNLMNRGSPAEISRCWGTRGDIRAQSCL